MYTPVTAATSVDRGIHEARDLLRFGNRSAITDVLLYEIQPMVSETISNVAARKSAAIELISLVAGLRGTAQPFALGCNYCNGAEGSITGIYISRAQSS
jgi:hypothetical protein